MADLSNAAVLFQDLADVASKLSGPAMSPKQVRRDFVSFVDLSQKLTAMMRREYSEKAGKKWEAKKFEGWNEITELLKKLRNTDEHEHPTFIQVHERQQHKIFNDVDALVIFEGTWEFSLEDQLVDTPRDDLLVSIVDPKTGGEQESVPIRTKYEFYLYPSTEHARELLEKIGESDVQSLVSESFKIYEEYYKYYSNQLARYGNNSTRPLGASYSPAA